jgi:hypothetical protein
MTDNCQSAPHLATVPDHVLATGIAATLAGIADHHGRSRPETTDERLDRLGAQLDVARRELHNIARTTRNREVT